MNKFIITLSGLFMVLSTSLYSQDVLTLNNQMMFSGKAVGITDCSLIFSMDSQAYIVPFDSIYTLVFLDTADPVIKVLEDFNADACLSGKHDAENYHGKKGLHITLGVLFGPFAVLGAAIGEPTPDKGRETLEMSKNKALFNDPSYLSCYKKKAKAQNVGNTAIGWGIGFLIIILLL